MEDNSQSRSEPTLVFDNFDIDIVVKVLSHTAFSETHIHLLQGSLTRDPGPFFVFLVPVFLAFQSSKNLLFGPGPLDWGDQIVLITGGSSGIGELLANTLAVRNVTVVVLGLHPIVTENYNIAFYKCDVTKWEEVEAVSKKVIEEVGHPTVLVNNAGVAQGKLILDLSPEDVRQTFNVNTLAHFWTLKAFLPEMIKQKSGHVVTVASVMGFVGVAQMTDYNASKAAAISLQESLRYELDHRYHAPKIRTSLIVPGHVLTPLFSTIRFPKNPFFRFCFPSLEPFVVVKKIIATLDEQHSQTIYLPFYANFMPFLRFLPSFLRDFAQWLTNADYSMDRFVKITGRRDDEGPVPELSPRSKSD
ncbi:retinal short-chain dehydrogenase/reductase [Lactifluus volemus]|nr:retinal short-chain dehydrogenase/reductase [Lactifluus volemus]